MNRSALWPAAWMLVCLMGIEMRSALAQGQAVPEDGHIRLTDYGFRD